MLPIITVITISVIAIIFWHKKINPETSWIYGLYVICIVVIFLIAVIVFQQSY